MVPAEVIKIAMRMFLNRAITFARMAQLLNGEVLTFEELEDAARCVHY
jgi:hypothetical protein